MSQRQQFDAKCSSCGEATTVPFKPSPDKPVYCRTCFNKRLASPASGSGKINNFESKQAWARRR